jgi:anti-anti-sigma factor
MHYNLSETPQYIQLCILDDVIDFNNITSFKDLLDQHIKGKEESVILDLSQVSYIGSVGLGMISLTAVSLKEECRPFAIICNTDEVRRLFRISGLLRVLTIVESEKEAYRFVELQSEE